MIFHAITIVSCNRIKSACAISPAFVLGVRRLLVPISPQPVVGEYLIRRQYPGDFEMRLEMGDAELALQPGDLGYDRA